MIIPCWLAEDGPGFSYEGGMRIPQSYMGAGMVIFTYPGFLGSECWCWVCKGGSGLYTYEHILIV